MESISRSKTRQNAKTFPNGLLRGLGHEFNMRNRQRMHGASWIPGVLASSHLSNVKSAMNMASTLRAHPSGYPTQLEVGKRLIVSL